MTHYLQLTSELDVQRLLAAAWRRYHAEVIARWAQLRSLSARTPASWVAAGRPLPRGPVNWNPAVRRFVWARVEAPRINVLAVPDAGWLVVLEPERGRAIPALGRWIGQGAPLRVPADVDLGALQSVSNLTWRDPLVQRGRQPPAQRARLCLGEQVLVTGLGNVSVRPDAQPVVIAPSEMRNRSALTGAFADAAVALEDQLP